MERNGEIQEHYEMSLKYLQTAKASLASGLFEPAMFNAIHSLELAMKAALLTELDESPKTHNIGGLFGRHFRDEIGRDLCSSANLILAKYNLPRYPGQRPLKDDEVREDVDFIEKMIEDHIGPLVLDAAPSDR